MLVCVSWYVDGYILLSLFFFFQAEDGIRDLVRSRGLGDVYKRQAVAHIAWRRTFQGGDGMRLLVFAHVDGDDILFAACLLYTSDAADDLLCVDLGGRRIIKKKKTCM